MKEEIDISVIVPVYNEAQNLLELHRRLRNELASLAKEYEIIFIDDGDRKSVV